MLRDFINTNDIALITNVLERFGFNASREDFRLSLIDYEALSPDSFLFTLSINRDLYYMYAEDYVPSLKYIQEELNSIINHKNWNFVPPKYTTEFESSSPVLSASIYEKPTDAKKITEYAVDSGYDFVFLAKVNEQA